MIVPTRVGTISTINQTKKARIAAGLFVFNGTAVGN
jgi:hypothetical protein